MNTPSSTKSTCPVCAALGLPHTRSHSPETQMIELSVLTDRPELFSPVRVYDQLLDLREWQRGLRAIPLDDREARFRYLGQQIGAWLSAENRLPALEARALVSLDEIEREQLWREKFALEAAGRVEPFERFSDFAAAFLHRWGRGDSPSRLVHRRKAARLWLRLEAAHLPLPPVLSRLEKLPPGEEGFQIYAELANSAGGDRAPTEEEIEEKMAELNGTETPRAAKKRAKANLRDLYKRLADYAASKSDPYLDAFVEEFGLRLEELRESAKEKPPIAPTGRTPRYDSSLGCPFRFEEYFDAKERKYFLAMDVAPLPHPYPYQIKTAPLAVKQNWLFRAEEDGAMAVRIELSADPHLRNAECYEVFSFALRICDVLVAPAPTPPIPWPASIPA